MCESPQDSRALSKILSFWERLRGRSRHCEVDLKLHEIRWIHQKLRLNECALCLVKLSYQTKNNGIYGDFKGAGKLEIRIGHFDFLTRRGNLNPEIFKHRHGNLAGEPVGRAVKGEAVEVKLDKAKRTNVAKVRPTDQALFPPVHGLGVWPGFLAFDINLKLRHHAVNLRDIRAHLQRDFVWQRDRLFKRSAPRLSLDQSLILDRVYGLEKSSCAPRPRFRLVREERAMLCPMEALRI